jgi:hypothetical protein
MTCGSLLDCVHCRMASNESIVEQGVQALDEGLDLLLNCQNPVPNTNATQVCIGKSKYVLSHLDANEFFFLNVFIDIPGRSVYDIRHSDDDPVLNMAVNIYSMPIDISNTTTF